MSMPTKAFQIPGKSRGITWVLDGLEVTLAGSIAGALEASPRLRFTASDIGLASSFYLAGAVIGALGFGWMTDRLGRRLLRRDD
jgi:MFS family permease